MLAALVAAGALLAPAAPVAAPAWELETAERVVAVSDIHGAHAALVETLRSAGILDAGGQWSGGRAQLVVVGDVVDRGDDSRAALDLLMRLEQQAAAAGGRLHFVLGNHELMNLVGDLRYVARGEFAAFAAEETEAQRAAAFARHNARRAAPGPGQGAPLTRAEFDARFPAGFFAHRAAFAASGRYGRWLLGKPLALRIGETLFVHAGLSTALDTLGMAGVNGALRQELVEYVTLLEQLTARGLLEPTLDFYALAEALPAPAAEGGAAPAVDPELQRLVALQDSLLHARTSPLWYRGSAGCGPLIEQDRLARSLARFGARRMVIGHTPTFQRRAWRRLGDRVFMIDAGMQRAYYQGQGAALVIERGATSVVYQGAAAATTVEALDERAGALSANLSPEELEAALAGGELRARSTAGGAEVHTLGWRGLELQAVFLPAAGPRGPFPEAAAYRLDRLLGLGMVPAAVVRAVDGRAGTLQFLPRPLVSEARRQAGEARVDAWCPLPDQWQAMALFDALVGNAPRRVEDLQYLGGSGQLVLTGHAMAFGLTAALPPQLLRAETGPSELWRSRLAALDSAAARAALAGLLSKRQLQALLRRAQVLAASGAAARPAA